MSALAATKVDFNAKARVINLVRKEEKIDPEEKYPVKSLLWEGKEFGVYVNEPYIPEERLVHPNENDMTEFLKKNFDELNHGDLLRTKTTDRAGGVYIVCYDENLGQFKAILNPDEAGSGYLTIPSEVLKNVTRAMEKYRDAFAEDTAQILNMHISPKDDFIADKLGKEVPESWEIDLFVNEGEVEEAYVRISETDEWQDFDIEDSSIESIQDMFYEGEKSKFTVTVELRDEMFDAYKQKYGGAQEKPVLPSKWRCEKGASSGGANHQTWDWIFSGPAESLSDAKKAVETFLDGFTYSHKEEK